jgi:predicted transcriptional regulator
MVFLVILTSVYLFQQFFIECDVAPLWDPDKRAFVALMTSRDFLFTVKKRLSAAHDLPFQPICDILALDDPPFIHNEFNSIDAEDSVRQLCSLLLRLNVEYIPIVDPDEGNLVAVLGYLDILHLLVQLSHRLAGPFSVTLDSTPIVQSLSPVPSIPLTGLLTDALGVMMERDMTHLPLTDSTGRTIGMYQPSDTAFISKLASASDNVVSIISSIFQSQDLAEIRELQCATGSVSPALQQTCTVRDTIKSVIQQMVALRQTRLACVDSSGLCVGIVHVKDILSHLLLEPLSP